MPLFPNTGDFFNAQFGQIKAEASMRGQTVVTAIDLRHSQRNAFTGFNIQRLAQCII